MNKTLISLLATSALFLSGTAHSADEADPVIQGMTNQEQAGSSASETTQESAQADQAPAETEKSSEAAESTDEAAK